MIYGSLCHAPIVYNWMRLASVIVPGNTLRAIGKKVRHFALLSTMRLVSVIVPGNTLRAIAKKVRQFALLASVIVPGGTWAAIGKKVSFSDEKR